jgi:hypothetical protein
MLLNGVVTWAATWFVIMVFICLINWRCHLMLIFGLSFSFIVHVVVCLVIWTVIWVSSDFVIWFFIWEMSSGLSSEWSSN